MTLLPTLLWACTPDDPPPPPAGSTADTGPLPGAHTGDPPPPTHTGDPAPTGVTGHTGGPPPTDRDRLLRGYLAHLQTDPGRTMSNGLRGRDLPDVCALWDGLAPSAQDTFLTLTARLEGSTLADGTTMLSHVTTAWRVVGGDGATSADPGSCGGGEFNRMIVSIDPALHDALLASHRNGGGPGDAGVPDLRDIPTNGVWKDSGDLAGPHAPFTHSNDTEDGAPRGQVHYFVDPASPAATSPLGRLDVEDLVDAFALEMDHDYDCAHNSNPGCEYVFYGALCLPETRRLGTEIYTSGYGSYDPGWTPTGC
jgi:hypothetical protein